jgi:uncharacterized protein (DUF169 family)
MTTPEEYNSWGEELERLLLLRTSPIAVKMLEKEADVPEGAVRPRRDEGVHYAQCQVFTMARRLGKTVAMLKEDNWCWTPPIAYGLVPMPDDPFVQWEAKFPCFELGRYVGLVTAPLKTANFIPDLVLIYSNTAQLRSLLLAVKQVEDTPLTSQFDAIGSCAFSIVPVVLTGEYRITIPDPGEAARAFAGDEEIIFSVPAARLTGLMEGLRRLEARKMGYRHAGVEMTPDFPRPEFYRKLYKDWGMEVEGRHGL